MEKQAFNKIVALKVTTDPQLLTAAMVGKPASQKFSLTISDLLTDGTTTRGTLLFSTDQSNWYAVAGKFYQPTTNWSNIYIKAASAFTAVAWVME